MPRYRLPLCFGEEALRTISCERFLSCSRESTSPPFAPASADAFLFASPGPCRFLGLFDAAADARVAV